jgi:hypothetical protein
MSAHDEHAAPALHPPALAEIHAARDRIAGIAIRTPEGFAPATVRAERDAAASFAHHRPVIANDSERCSRTRRSGRIGA